MFWTTWNRPNEYPPIKIQPNMLEIIVDLRLCLLKAFSIISCTSSLDIELEGSDFIFSFNNFFILVDLDNKWDLKIILILEGKLFKKFFIIKSLENRTFNNYLIYFINIFTKKY